MITHTQARKAFIDIMDGEPTYPFNSVLSSAQGKVNILGSIGYLHVYFKGIDEGLVKDFLRGRQCFFSMMSFFPGYYLNENYNALYKYFCQGLNYTPLNLYKSSFKYL